MTTEEKAKAYDEAIKRAKPLMLDTNFSMKNTVISIFPELNESEDERIRKAIMEVLKRVSGATDVLESEGTTFKKAMIWFEKQKAKERLDRMAPIYNDKESFESALEKAWKYYNESASRTVDSFEDDYIECVFSKGFREGFLYREKQKELPTNEEMLRTLRVEYEKGVTDTIAKYDQEEQKPDFIVPKRIRPKFAVGDTVCRPMWSDHTIREIYIDCNDPVYVCVNDEGLESHISFSEQDEWERKEQKPVKKEIALTNFEEVLNTFLFDFANSPIEDCEPKEYTKKHSAEILKAAYTELSVQQPHLYGRNETADRLVSLAECLEMDGDCLFNGYSGTECGKFLRDLAIKQVECKPVEWSKEDDEMRINILQEIANIKDVFPKINIQPEFDWLKFLPERFNLQPKQEWNEKDNIMFENIILCLKEYCLTDEIKWLKSLRPPQYCENCKLKRSVENWKPSEEQMEHLKRCFSHGKPHLPMPNQHVLESLYNDLKKLF